MKQYSNEELKKMHYHLARGRSFSIKMVEAVYAGHIKSAFHTPLGQEAVGVAVALTMGPNDWFCSTHRDECACMIKYDPYKFISEIFGKRDGIQMGTAFDYHASDWDNGMVTPIATLGSNIPLYAGFAWGLKKQGKDSVVIVSHGDGASSEGAVHEGWNLIGLNKVPFVHLLENNEWAMTTPISRQCVNPDVSERAKPFGLKTFIVDGTDLLAMMDTLEKAIETARKGEPCVVEAKLVRWGMHFVGDPTKRPDTDKVEAAMKNRDCLKNFEKYLIEQGVCDAEYLADVRKKCDAELDSYIAKAAAAPIVNPKEVFKKEYVYANAETGGDL